MRRPTVILAMVALLFGACSDDKTPDGGNDLDAGHHDAATSDAGGEDAGSAVDDASDQGGDDAANMGGDDAGGEGDTDHGDDAGEESDCLQVTVSNAWRVTYDADPSIEYSARANPAVEGNIRDLSVLFERYSPDLMIGSFDLGVGANENFGTCPQCVFMRTDVPERAYFADRGTLESKADPYGRRPDFTVTNLRLIEVEVDQATRASTPIEDGRCIEVAEFTVEGTFAPQGWTCPQLRYGDGEYCDCECGVTDPDCYPSSHCLPGDTSCNDVPDLPIAGCNPGETCAADPTNGATSCFETCDWAAASGCSIGTCVFDSGLGEGDLCIDAPQRIAPGVAIGEACPSGTNYQIVCNVVDGFAQGYCGPNDVCRSLCESDAECTEPGHTCRDFFGTGIGLGYCGPVPVDN